MYTSDRSKFQEITILIFGDNYRQYYFKCIRRKADRKAERQGKWRKSKMKVGRRDGK